MPHARAHSWASLEPRAAASWYSNSSVLQYGKGGGGLKSYNNNDNTHNHQRSSQQRHVPTRPIPTITNPEKYCPVPYTKPKEKQVSVSVKPVNNSGKTMAAKTLAIEPLSPLCWLPCMPTSTYNPRNELQRRTSPTSISFGPTFPTSPPLTPLTPASVQTFLTKHTDFKTPHFGATDEEPVYVLTLRTSDEIAQQMQALRQKWFPADRLKVPAHVTLFHALPESRLPQIEQHIVQLARQTQRFEISTGRVMKMRKGVLVNLHAGDTEVRRLYVSLRSAFFEWLREQDKSCKAHWTIQNKEEDAKRVEDAFQDTSRAATGLGWATGLVLWRYEGDGRWTREKEFEFARRGSEQYSPRGTLESEDGWPVYR